MCGINGFNFSDNEKIKKMMKITKNRGPDAEGIFENENDYPYLIKEWDSADEGFAYHVKIFRVDYDLFNPKQ